MKQVQRFKCDYCNKTTAREETMKRHEAECIHNPNSRNCFMCEFSCVDDYEDYEPWWGNYTVKDVAQCVYTDERLHRGDALKCEHFIRSNKSNFSRSYQDAVNNYERYRIGGGQG